jgi:polyhydroxyalkanoate synthase
MPDGQSPTADEHGEAHVPTLSPASEAIRRLRHELERNAVRARNGLRYVAGSQWLPPGPTPRDIVWREGKVVLWRYRNTSIRYRQPLLIFLGLVSRSTIFDLHEKASFVAQLRDAGFDAYVLDWGEPDEADSGRTISTYASRYLPRAVRSLLRKSGATDFTMIGYCMGGNLALLAAAGHPDLPLRNLITMATPIDLTQLSPFLEPLIDGTHQPDELIDWTGCVPPDVVYALFSLRKPTAEIVQYVNLWENLWNDQYVGPHQAIARWARDHVPMPGAAFREIVNSWLRNNAFATNALWLDGRRVDLRSIRVPTLTVIASQDGIVPPQAARCIEGLLGSDDFELLEVNAGHIGLTVSGAAIKTTIPRIVSWLRNHSDPVEDSDDDTFDTTI